MLQSGGASWDVASKNLAYCAHRHLVFIHEKGLHIDPVHRLFVCISHRTPHHELPRRHQGHRPLMRLSRGCLLATSVAPLLNFLVQLLVEGPLFVVEPQLVCNDPGCPRPGRSLWGGAFGSVMACFPSPSKRQILALSTRCLAKPATEDFASSSNDVA